MSAGAIIHYSQTPNAHTAHTHTHDVRAFAISVFAENSDRVTALASDKGTPARHRSFYGYHKQTTVDTRKAAKQSSTWIISIINNAINNDYYYYYMVFTKSRSALEIIIMIRIQRMFINNPPTDDIAPPTEWEYSQFTHTWIDQVARISLLIFSLRTPNWMSPAREAARARRNSK